MIRNRHLDSFSLKCQSFTIHIFLCLLIEHVFSFRIIRCQGYIEKKNSFTGTWRLPPVTYRYMTVRSFRYSASKNVNFAILPLTFYIVCHRLFDHWEKFRELMNFFQGQHKLCRAYLTVSTVSWRKIYSIKLFGQFWHEKVKRSVDKWSNLYMKH